MKTIIEIATIKIIIEIVTIGVICWAIYIRGVMDGIKKERKRQVKILNDVIKLIKEE